MDDPSMVVATSATRRAKRMLADNRASAIQSERYNPVNPKSELMRNKNGVMGMSGSGATPSMGLSEYRGGGFLGDMAKKAYGAVKKMNSKDVARALNTGVAATKGINSAASALGYKGSGMKHTLLDHLAHPKKGYGTKKGQMRLSARRAYEPASEAEAMGHHLSKHIMDLHGGGFHNEFLHGMSGGSWYDFLDPNKNGVGNAFNTVKNEFVNPSSVLRHDIAPKVANEFTDPNSILRGKVIPIGAQVAQYASPFIDAALPGLGTAINTGFKAANYANKGAKMAGFGSEASRAKTMLGMNKAGRARNNGVPLLSGNVDGVRGGANTGAYEGHGHNNLMEGGMLGSEGHGMRKKRMVGAGVSARASLVKKVMADQGLNMIQASKYVKEHNLSWH